MKMHAVLEGDMQIRNSNISPFLVRNYPEPKMGCLRLGAEKLFSADAVRKELTQQPDNNRR